MRGWPLVLLAGCAAQGPPEEDRVAALEARIAQLEVEKTALEVRVVQAEAQARAALAGALPGEEVAPLTLRGLELRVQDLEQRLVAAELPAEQASPEAVGLPRVEVDPQTGALVPRLDEAAALSCAVRLADSLRTAQLAHDAAFDAFSEDLQRIGWAPEVGADGCAAHVAVAAEVEPGSFTAIAVITRGTGRGRQVRAGPGEAPREGPRLDEAGIATFLAGHQWAGSAR